MSFSFYIPAPVAPDCQRIFDHLDYWDLHCNEGELEDGPWPEGTVHFYREQVSTRGVEVTYENNSFQVRILTLSSPEDYELALRFAEAAANELEQMIEPEDYDAISVEELRQRYDANWIEQTNQSGAAVIRQLVTESDTNVITTHGSIRPFHLGPRLFAELDEAGPEEEFLDRLMDRMRAVQNVDGEEYFFANLMEAQKNSDDLPADAPDKITFAVLGPEVAYLLPDAQFFALIAGEDEPPVFIEYDKLPLILPEDSWSYLDERQMLVDAIDEGEWPDILRKAKHHEVRLF